MCERIPIQVYEKAHKPYVDPLFETGHRLPDQVRSGASN